MCARDTKLVVLDLFVDVAQLQVELVYNGSGTVLVITTARASRDIDPIEDLIHRVTSVHLQQVLVYREEPRVLGLLDKILKVRRVADVELLRGILIFFHVEAVLNGYVSVYILTSLAIEERVE